jgi:EF hand
MIMRGASLGLVALALMAAPAAAQSNDRVAIPVGSGRTPPVGPTPPSLVVEPVAMMIAGCDADSDGRTSRDELHRCLAKSFAAIDTGNAGTLGYIAFADWAERWLGDRTALPSPFETDADGDNKITLAELDAKFDQIFARLDKDKDGFLTRAELLTIRGNINPGYEKRRKGAP